MLGVFYFGQPYFAGSEPEVAAVPAALVNPIITGTPKVGQTLATTAGVWANRPLSIVYQWQRSVDGVSGWTNIPGATSTAYVVTSSDVPRFLRSLVTASNLAGASSAPSNVLGPVRDLPRPWGVVGGTLGCGVYDVAILARGGGQLVAQFPWTSLTWERVLDDTSAAQVSAAGYPEDCCATLEAIRPWRHEVALFRNGDLVWVGPVVVPKAPPPDSFQIDARDLSAWWDHRLIHNDHAYANPTDLATIFADLAADAMSVDSSPGLTVTPTPCGVTGVMSILAVQHAMAGLRLRDLAATGIDWTAVGRTVLAGGAVIPTASIGTFEDGHFAVPPTPRFDGTAQANSWLVRGNGGGAAGDTVYGQASDAAAGLLDGVLESVDTVSTIQDNASAQAAAQTRVALTKEVALVEGCVLSPEAPFTIDQLVPGALCELNLVETCIPVSGEYRLQKVAGTAQGGGEAITLTFQPVGTAGP